ncbi:MAG TPA: hypothetical protein VKA98_10100 [Nitrososphaeraceae archaeon]|nr:hypothetical protein [Nitrososphaeraceae archaeon]
MQNSNDDPNVKSLKLRGRRAVDVEHRNKVKEDEIRINSKIAEIYSVELEEAKDIHINYHSDRILFFLMGRAKKNGMTDSMFFDRVKNLDIYEHASMVAQGELIEMAAVDVLYKELCEAESKGSKEDRYINFYG